MFLSKRGNIWYVWYIDETTGKKNKFSTGCFRKSDAFKYLATHPHSSKSSAPKKRLSEFQIEFQTINARSYSSGTLNIFDRGMTSLIAVLGDVSISSITPRHIDLFKNR